MKASLDFGLVTITYRFDKQVAEPLLAEKLAQDIEHSSAERLALQLNLFEEPLVYVALAGFVREKVPQMAHFGLPDAVDAPEPLFETVWVPGKIIVDHQMRAL